MRIYSQIDLQLTDVRHDNTISVTALVPPDMKNDILLSWMALEELKFISNGFPHTLCYSTYSAY